MWRPHGGFGACIDSATLHCHDTSVSPDERFSLTELADLAGVTPRTVRYYLGQALLPAVGPSGPGSKYGATHLARLRLIRRLQAEHLPLAEIRRRLDDLDEVQIRDLIAAEEPAPPDTALEYLRTVLDGSRAMREGPASQLAAARPAMRDPGVALARRSLARRDFSAPPPATDTTRVVAEPTAIAAAGEAGPASPSLERSQWERVALGPDVELHIRRPLTRAHQKQVDRLVTIARELLEEDRP
jgi:DNA-binding transcriptional MerR regulator